MARVINRAYFGISNWSHLCIVRRVVPPLRSSNDRLSISKFSTGLSRASGSDIIANLKIRDDNKKNFLARNNPTVSAEYMTEEEATKYLSTISAEDSKLLKVFKLEYDLFFSTGVRVPEVVTNKDWVHLLRNCPSVPARKRHYSFILSTEREILRKRKKASENIKRAEEKREEINKLIAEGLEIGFKNAFLMRVLERTMNMSYHNNICYSMIHGPHLVFDFDFEESMTEKELKNLSVQMQFCHGINKVAREPFHFHFCNVKPESRTSQQLVRSGISSPDIPIDVTSKDYKEVYPKDRLVYLSPNAPNVLKTFNRDDVYIIGGIVDTARDDPLTFAKAKKENIRMAKLPLDHYLKWQMGQKSLPLNIVLGILLDVKATNNWKESLLKNIPPSCIDPERAERKRNNSFRNQRFEY